MTALQLPVEQRPKRRWIAFFAAGVVGFTALAVAGIASILSRSVDPGGAAFAIGFIALPLLGLIVIPGSWWLLRVARGKPDVRLDWQGITWGDDRSTDPFVAWTGIERVELRSQRSQYVTDEMLVIYPIGPVARAHLGPGMRLVLAVNQRLYGSPLVISTVTGRLRADEIAAVVAARFKGQIVDRRAD
jgi:hypothetical protein